MNASTMTDAAADAAADSAASTSARRILVVGYGMVGHRCAEQLARLAPDAAITVLAEEPRPAYDRVHLTTLFDGATAELLTYAAPPGVRVLTGDPAVSLDRAAQTVTTRSGAVHEYDALVLATGSRPFVPPVPGHDLPGCFVYRTIDDVDEIKRYAAGRRVGAVVGGGLLGLEAAGALRSLGLQVHVVEFAPRLMPLQVDDAGGAALRQRIEELGVTVRTGTRTEAVRADSPFSATGTGAAAVMLLACGGEQRELAVDLVVFAAGVRPCDALGREFGLDVGERGGIRIDEFCRTSDPRIYAVGECAQAVDGRVYGLVAPGYAMAETAARHITGHEPRPFTGADLSTKLKLLGVDVASFGDAFASTAGALSTFYADESAGLYKKLVVTEDGRLLGGILVGDASGYDTLKPMAGTDTALPASPIRLLLPPGEGSAPALGVGSLPDSATICSCHNVTKGELIQAIAGDGCTTVSALKSCTKAGTGCGSCVPTLGKLLESSGVEQSTALCAHFPQSRAELYEIILVRGIGSFARLLAEHGSGAEEGCEVCKPAVASILASLAGRLDGPAHVLSGEQAALQDTNDHFLANLQRNGSYSVVPRIPGGEITPERLIVIGEVARDFGLYTKITGGQRIDLLGARVEQLPAIWRRLVDAGFESGHAYGKAVRTVKSCVGSTWCRYGVQDSVRLAIDLELRYRGLRAPHKIKAAVSGCARECAEAQGKDVGVIATERGWNLYVGGNGGFRPRHADLLAADLSEARLIRAIDRFLMFYVRTADRLERTATWIERIDGGLDHVRAVVIDDSLGLGAELDRLMREHVACYADEWRAALDDPETLRRFVSFVNAPQEEDRSVRFTAERDQIKPLLNIGPAPEPKELVSAP